MMQRCLCNTIRMAGRPLPKLCLVHMEHCMGMYGRCRGDGDCALGVQAARGQGVLHSQQSTANSLEDLAAVDNLAKNCALQTMTGYH